MVVKIDHRTRTFLRNKAGKYLLMLRVRSNGDRAILLPGGGVESGETPYEANARELYEELGIFIIHVVEIGKIEETRANPALRPRDENYGVKRPCVFHFFFSERWDGDVEIKEADRFESLHWIDLNQISTLGSKLNARWGDGVLESIKFLQIIS